MTSILSQPQWVKTHLKALRLMRVWCGWCHRSCQGPLTRYIKLRVAHAPGMPGTFSPPPPVGDPNMHYGTRVTHVSWCMSGSLTRSFLWSRLRGKRPRHSPRMRNQQVCVSGKWSKALWLQPVTKSSLLWNSLSLRLDYICLLVIGFQLPAWE